MIANSKQAVKYSILLVRPFLIFIVGLIIGTMGCSKQNGAARSNTDALAAQAPDLTPITDAGLKTLTDLQSGRAAGWTARFFSKTGKPGFDVDVVRQGTNVSWTFFLATDRTNGFLLRILQTNGVWILRDDRGISRWRPHEARLKLFGAYSLLSGAEPLAATEEILSKAEFVRRTNSTLLYGVQMSADEKKATESMLKNFRGALSEVQAPQRRDIEDAIRVMTGLLEKGMPVVIDEKLGIVRYRPFFQGAVRILNFTWLQRDAPQWAEFDIGETGSKIEDHTRPITEWDVQKCAVIMHDPAYAPHDSAQTGKAALAPDPYILNIESGEIRRVPFRGVAPMLALFLKDRRTVVVCGMDPTQRDFVKVDLGTGENTTIQIGPVRPGRMESLTELSADGKRLGFLEVAMDQPFLQQARWLDLESGVTHDIGKPVEAFGHFSWLPDGSAIVFERAIGGRRMTDVPGRMVAVMRMDGSVKDLGEGDAPTVLRKSRRILFRSNGKEKAAEWMTMDLNGEDKKVVSGGLTNCVQAGVSPDEAKILFRNQVGPGNPQPYVFDMRTGELKRITQVDGFLGDVQWR